MLDIKKIQQLIEMMVTNDLVELTVRDGAVEVQLRRPTAPAEGVATAAPMVIVGGASPVPAQPAPPAEVEEKLHEIRSPMVGTYYEAPNPESPPFVTIGSQVHAESVVCIVEAMKVFNELKAETSGTIVKILVENGQPLEYDQPMFLVRPD